MEQVAPTTLRERYRDFVTRHEVAWELFFAVLAVVFVAMAFVPVEPGTSEEDTLVVLEWLITGVFIAEFSTRLWAAESRRAYVRSHWIDLVSCVPPTRWLRPFRLIRLLRLVRTFAGVGRALTHFDRMGRHKGLVWLVVAWVGVMFLCAVGMYIAENGTNPAFHDPLDALWWGLSTMTTVGYGDVYPLTAEGRLSAAVLMILGIGLYSLITATVTSFLLSSDNATPDVAGQLERLAALHGAGAVSDDEYRAAKAAVIAVLG